MNTRVLDSWSLLEWIVGRQPACDIVGAWLADAEEGNARLLMSAINAGEIYYSLRKNHSMELADYWREAAPTLPITVEVPGSLEVWAAAELKARYPIAYPDAFAVALAMKHSCPLMTGDPELRVVDKVDFDWIGRPEPRRVGGTGAD